MRVVTGDVDIVEYTIGRGMAPVHSGSTGIQPLYIKIIKSGISDIVIGESCDIEMESGGEVGTLVSWHTVASGHQAPPLHTPLLRVSRQITILQSLYPV